MTLTVTEDDLAFLRRVQALIDAGQTQAEIAAELGLSGAGALHGRINRIGFQIRSRSEILCGPTGQRLADLLRSGGIVAATRETAEAVA